MALTAKQARFCEEYLVDLNASAAARRAGYSLDTAGSTGNENLQKPEIQAELSRLMAERIGVDIGGGTLNPSGILYQWHPRAMCSVELDSFMVCQVDSVCR